MQDYLKAILVLSHGESASTKDIATHLGISPASVTGMLKKLDDLKLANYESYKGATLTHAGRKIALEMLRHHRLIETYLVEALGYEWDEVHEEAERLEHHISEKFEDRIAKALGDPQYDPHGDPIPTKDGKMPPVVNDRLSDANVGERVTIRRVSARNNDTLSFLREQGISLGTQLRIEDRDDAASVMTVKHRRSRIDLPTNECRIIFVQR